MRSFLGALQFLTVFPWPQPRELPVEEAGTSSSFFPLVGFGLGMVLVLFNWLLEAYVPSEILSVMLVTLLIVMTRGLHLDGLGDTFDGIGAGGSRENALRVMDDSHTGVFGLLAILVVVLFKVRAVEVMGEERWRALLLAPVFGRWAMVVLAYGSRSAREGLGRILVEHMRGRHLFLATVITLILVVVFSGRLGLWITLGIASFMIGSRRYLHHRLGGITGDTLGAVGELTETSALVLFALFP